MFIDVRFESASGDYAKNFHPITPNDPQMFIDKTDGLATIIRHDRFREQGEMHQLDFSEVPKDGDRNEIDALLNQRQPDEVLLPWIPSRTEARTTEGICGHLIMQLIPRIIVCRVIG